MTYGPGVQNVDLSVHKEWHIVSERNVLQLRFQAFNSFNHFNPQNPNMSLTLNYAGGAEHQRQLPERSPPPLSRPATDCHRSGSRSRLLPRVRPRP